MRAYFAPLIVFQRFYIPAMIVLFLWATWRMVAKKDFGVGLALYISLVIVVDGYLNTGLFLPGLEKGSIRYSEICAAFLLCIRPKAETRLAPFSIVCFLVASYFSLLILAALRTPDLMSSLMECRRLIFPQIVAFLVTMRGVNSNEDYRRFFMCMTALTIIIGTFIFYDVFFDLWVLKSDVLFTTIYGMNRAHGRFGGFFLNPNYLGAFVVMTFPAAFAWTLGQEAKLKAFGAIGLLTLVFCLVETQSRGPLLAFGITLMLLLVGPAGDVSRSKRIAVFATFAVVLVLLMPGFFEHAAERFDEIDQEMTTESPRTRETIWGYTERAIADNPLLGIGFGEKQFLNIINNDYGFMDQYGESSLDNPHNSYLQMTVYAGFPVLISFVLANLLTIFRGARCILEKSAGRPVVVAFGLVVGVTGYLAVIYPDMHMFTQTVAPVYWVYFGLLLTLATASAQPAAVANAYEDNRAHLGNAGQCVVGEPASWRPQHRGDRRRKTAIGAERSREGRTPADHDPAPRHAAHDQQAGIQLGAFAFPDGLRRANGQPELVARRRGARLRPSGTDAGRPKR